MFSRGQTCRGKSQDPVVWIAEVRATETLKPIDTVSLGKIDESPGRNKSGLVANSRSGCRLGLDWPSFTLR